MINTPTPRIRRQTSNAKGFFPCEPRPAKPEIDVQTELKSLLLKEPSLSAADLHQHLARKGHEVSLSAVKTIYSEFCHTVQFLRGREVLNPDPFEQAVRRR